MQDLNVRLQTEPISPITMASGAVLAMFSVVFYFIPQRLGAWFTPLLVYARFAYNCFFKPHEKQSSNQMAALESFYKAQATIYDSTRTALLKGREDLLGLMAAQMQWRVETGVIANKPIWVDIGGGTGYNIEAMGRYVDIETFFERVILVDLSPSLTAVAVARVQRMGWKNVQVVCQDARDFRLEDHYMSPSKRDIHRPDMITMSYSLSMIPDFYSVVDALAATLSKNGIIGVADFYVQNEVEYRTRDHVGGVFNRHCMWISRVFWRTWFEADRVNLEAARRDFLEYRFDTILNFNERCRLLGFRIPYYVWIGCAKKGTRVTKQNSGSPLLSALDLQSQVEYSDEYTPLKTGDDFALVTLPTARSTQTHPWRLSYDYWLQKHLQFGQEYIYAFTWEDSQEDLRILNIQPKDSILAISSAGDNVLAYACKSPKRIHAVDLNPNQNHLLELKLAAFSSLGHADIWALFGQGKHSSFRDILISRLSPHLSSPAFQYWLHHGPKTFDETGRGLYFTGGSRHALNLVRWLSHIFGLQPAIDQMCNAKSLEEQRGIWKKRLRGIILSRWLSYLILSNKAWLWRALGVPVAQRDLIEADWNSSAKHAEEKSQSWMKGGAIWQYCIDTLEPVATHTHLRTANHYYLLPLLGHYTKHCHPDYLDAEAFQLLSRPGALDCLRIHTDEIHQVLCRLEPGTLTIAVVMDSFDWFSGLRSSDRAAASEQVRVLRHVLADGGRVLLRSAGIQPWYLELFRAHGFITRAIAIRRSGKSIDQVNMYASTWLCTKSSPAS